jgi:dTDP-glucose pyrophosphorylase
VKKKNLKKYKKNIIKINTKLINVINIFDTTNVPCAFVINKNGDYLGTISDGDIRRALLKKISLNDTIKNIYNKKSHFIFLKDINNLDKVRFVTSNFIIRFVPVLYKKKIIDIIDRENISLSSKIKNDVIIMAGGHGKRLLPITNKIPKPLIKIKGKPIISKIISNLSNQGFTNFTIILNYLGKKIIEYFKTYNLTNINIKFIIENKELGTFGGVSLVKKLSDNFILMNGDVISNLNFRNMLEIHEKKRNLATLGVINYNRMQSYGVVYYRNENLIKIKEKPQNIETINSGIYVFNKKVLKLINKNSKIDTPEFLNKLGKKVKIYPIYEKWSDIGTYEDLKRARRND